MLLPQIDVKSRWKDVTYLFMIIWQQLDVSIPSVAEQRFLLMPI